MTIVGQLFAPHSYLGTRERAFVPTLYLLTRCKYCGVIELLDECRICIFDRQTDVIVYDRGLFCSKRC